MEIPLHGSRAAAAKMPRLFPNQERLGIALEIGVVGKKAVIADSRMPYLTHHPVGDAGDANAGISVAD